MIDPCKKHGNSTDTHDPKCRERNRNPKWTHDPPPRPSNSVGKFQYHWQ